MALSHKARHSNTRVFVHGTRRDPAPATPSEPDGYYRGAKLSSAEARKLIDRVMSKPAAPAYDPLKDYRERDSNDRDERWEPEVL